MTDYGMSYFLEDRTGKLTGSEFLDLNDRMRLIYRCTARDSTRTAYMVYDATTSSGASRPLFALDFGPNNQLGTISLGPNVLMEMKKYLTKLSPLGRYAVSFMLKHLPDEYNLSSRLRKFVASDGQEYRWSWRIKDNQEWTVSLLVRTERWIIKYIFSARILADTSSRTIVSKPLENQNMPILLDVC